MAKNDVILYKDGAFSPIGDRQFAVTPGTTASINAGEFVEKLVGTLSTVVFAAVTSHTSIGTTYLAGLSATASNETTTAAGTVFVQPFVPGAIYLCTCKTPTGFTDTQANYNKFVGFRVKYDVTGGVITILTTDGSSNPLVVEPLDISKVPNKVAFSVRAAALYNN